MKFNFLKKNEVINDSKAKNNNSNVSSKNKTETRSKRRKRRSSRNGMLVGSYSNSSNLLKSNGCLFIFIIYIILGYVSYQILK
jgi:hypothetical protein